MAARSRERSVLASGAELGLARGAGRSLAIEVECGPDGEPRAVLARVDARGRRREAFVLTGGASEIIALADVALVAYARLVRAARTAGGVVEVPPAPPEPSA